MFPHDCQEAGLTSAIVYASKILPVNQIPEDRRQLGLDLVHDRRRKGTTRCRTDDDVRGCLLGVAEGVRAAEFAKLRLPERLAQRVISENVLAGMKTVDRQ